MSNVLWSDERIDDLFIVWPIHYARLARRQARTIRDDYEAALAAANQRIAELEAERNALIEANTSCAQYIADREIDVARYMEYAMQLEARGEWEPVEDGMVEYPNWNGKGTVTIRILNDGAELEQWHDSLPDNIDEISLSADYRLCRRVREEEE